MSRPKTCCVPGCNDLVSSRHRFPKNDKETFKIWVNVIRHPRFSSLTPQEIYKSYCVCQKHFAEDTLVIGTKRGLKVGAVPTLHMPGNESVGCLAGCLPPPPKKTKLYNIPLEKEVTGISESPTIPLAGEDNYILGI